MTSTCYQCPIWGEKCPQEWDAPVCHKQSGNEMVCKCLRAGGSFKVSGPNPEVRMQSMVAALSGDAKVRLCGRIARENLVDKKIPVVDEGFVRLAETGRMPTMLERLDLALEWLVLSSGNKFGANPFGIPLHRDEYQKAMHEKSHAFMAYAHGHEEECFPMLDALGENIKYQILKDSKKIIGASVTAAGFARYKKWRESGSDSPQAFVAMWFNDSMDPLREAIGAAIVAAGYVPKFVDRDGSSQNQIENEALALIRQSRFAVVDFTAKPTPIRSAKGANPRGSVYYEAGFAKGLGRPVFFTCRKDYIKKTGALHFDISHFPQTGWEECNLGEGGKFRKELQERIEAEVGKGPKPPEPKGKAEE